MVSRLGVLLPSLVLAFTLAGGARADNSPPTPTAPRYAAPSYPQPAYPPLAQPATPQPAYPPSGAPQPGYPPGWGSPRPLGYGAPAPPGYYPPAETFNTWVPMRRRSPTMIALGSALISVATTALIAGSAFVAGSTQNNVCDDCPSTLNPTDTAAQNTGIGLIVLGVLAMGAGIPVLIIGAQKVPDRGDAGIAPTLRLTAGGAKVGFEF